MGNIQGKLSYKQHGVEKGETFISVSIRVQPHQETLYHTSLELSLPPGLIAIHDKIFLFICCFELGFLRLAKINFINIHIQSWKTMSNATNLNATNLNTTTYVYFKLLLACYGHTKFILQ